MDDKKISVMDLINDVEANYENEVTIHWHGHDIVVKKKLSLAEMLAFTSDVIDACYTYIGNDENESNARITYTPELGQYALDYMTIAYFTNIDLEVDGVDIYDFINHSDIIKQIHEVIDTRFFNTLATGIGDKIDFINESNILEMTQEFQRMNEVIQELVPTLSEMNESFTPENMKNVTELLSKIQNDNSLRELAFRTMKSEAPEMIEFAKQINGNNNG